MARILLSAALLLAGLPALAGGRFQLPASALSISWDGAALQAVDPGAFSGAETLVKSAQPAAVAAVFNGDEDEDEGDEADEEFDAQTLDTALFPPGIRGDGRLSIRSPYWKEWIDIVYRNADGTYDKAALGRIRRIFRDKLKGTEIDIPVGLIELLDAIQDHFRAERVELLCGYRSPERNARMRKKSTAVAKNSLHIKGWAADIRIDGVGLKALRDFSASLKRGGVGYYTKAGFVHVDVGRVRYW